LASVGSALSVSTSAEPGLAAVDLGSNSFHMIIARLDGDEPVTVDRLRDQVQLANGLDDDRNLNEGTMARALESLERFGQRLREMDSVRVRAVGTNSLRVARNAAEFLTRGEAALGHPIEVISGYEEARLIYLGIAHVLSDDSHSRLVVDIGGGSTEIMVGERFEATSAHSYHMGCVSFTRRFFADGKVTAKRMNEAVLAARLELHTGERAFRDIGWAEAAGASGTIRTVEAVCREAGWCEGGLTAKALTRFRKELIDAEQVSLFSFPGLKNSRAPIIAGGVAILSAVFDSLRVERMHVASGALQEGVLYDLLGRIRHEDVRVRTIGVFQDRYQVDKDQAERVDRTSRQLLLVVRDTWELPASQSARYLEWAARLHEIGLTISYNQHHRHGAYLLRNADMPGFSRDAQRLLSVLVGSHRRRIRPENLLRLRRRGRVAMATSLLVLLRLAVLLNRGRSPDPLPTLDVSAGKRSLSLGLPAAWLDSRPLTRVDLESEVEALKVLDFQLDVRALDDVVH
jgi:exopolyphosphatase/guanosine-5'-triphosphate,3'-diphosphate pyrophosphatase